jgi:hypothetical protein
VARGALTFPDSLLLFFTPLSGKDIEKGLLCASKGGHTNASLTQ